MKKYIKLYNILLKKNIWKYSTSPQKTILITILLLANKFPQEEMWKGKKVNCKPGQFITSLSDIQQAAGKDITTKMIRMTLKKFEEKYDFLVNESSPQGRLLTICNWQQYQLTEDVIDEKKEKEIKRLKRKEKRDAELITGAGEKLPPTGYTEEQRREYANKLYEQYARILKSGAKKTSVNYCFRLLKKISYEDLSSTIINYRSTKSPQVELQHIKRPQNFFSVSAGFYQSYLPEVFSEKPVNRLKKDDKGRLFYKEQDKAYDHF